MSEKKIGTDEATYETCEGLAQSYVDANARRVKEYEQQGLDSLASVHDAKRDTAQQIVNHISQFKASSARHTGKLRRDLDSKMHANINERQHATGAAKLNSGVKWEHWLYEGKRLMDELRRLPLLFKREREGTLPQAYRYCSLSPTEKLPAQNELMCCLGQKTAECQILRDVFKDADAFPPEMIDHAKAHVCAAHILSEEFGPHAIDTSEGYITESVERAFWQRTYGYMAMEPPTPECEKCGAEMTDADLDDSGKVGTVMMCRACLVKVDKTMATQ